jgi:transposase
MDKKVRHVVRLVLTSTLSDREIAGAAGVARNTAARYRELCVERGYSWEELSALCDDALDAKFNSVLRRLTRKRMPDLAYVHAEMQQKGVDGTVLWEEYRAPCPDDAMGYSQFMAHYRDYVASIDRVMRQTHLPGQKAFVDFSGLRPKIVDAATGVETPVELFVGVLGFSNYTFAMAVASQKIPDWIEAHNRMFTYFGGATEVTVPDNLKSAVTRAGVDPALNPTYRELGAHYGTEIVPARSYHPRDKASVEAGVRLVQRWILALLRKQTFFSLGELNDAIAELLERLNARPFKRLPGCRRSRFDEHERGQLKPLPPEPYQLAEWTGALLVDNSYHMPIGGHWYSVPHRLVGQRVSARICGGVVEFFHQHTRVAAHALSTQVGGHTTDPEHQPENHRSYADRSPETYLTWAGTVGPHTTAVVKHQFERAVPMLGLPACDALRKLVRIHGAPAVEAAAQRAVEIQSLTLKSVKSLLSSGRHLRTRHSRTKTEAHLHHPNVRGGDYYSQSAKEA